MGAVVEAQPKLNEHIWPERVAVQGFGQLTMGTLSWVNYPRRRQPHAI
jgi:hypothetical protein